MKKQRAERLRTTVNCLPPDTKRAMLDGLERNRIITGANTDRKGGMCPMIAADRNAFQSGPMADIFATVWDSYNGACILNRRDANERDLNVLKTMLQTSLADSPELSSELGQAWLDYHVGADPTAGVPEVDFAKAFADALGQSDLTDTGSFAAVPADLSPPSPAASPERTISIVYDGGPLPTDPAQASRLALPAADVRDADADAEYAAPAPAAMALNSTYEPYRVAAPKHRVAAGRSGVDQPGRSSVARRAAQAADSAARAQARAVIENQAATLRGRAWPRSADAKPAVAPAKARSLTQPAPPPTAGPKTRASVNAGASVRAQSLTPSPPATAQPLTPLGAPAIRQAAIPQRRVPQTQETAPATARHRRPAEHDDRTAEHDDRTAELEGRSGWSWLPPFRSYDDYEEALENAGQLEPGPRAVPEVQPPEEHRRPVRM